MLLAEFVLCVCVVVQLWCSLSQGLAVIFSHHQVCIKTYTWRCENITASPCVRCYYVGNQSCIEWFFNPLRNLLFILKIYLLLTGKFFLVFFLYIQVGLHVYQHNNKIQHTYWTITYIKYKFNITFTLYFVL